MTSFFIYYRVAPEAVHGLASAVNRIQAVVRAATGIDGRLMRRDDATETWMEIYEDVGDTAAFETLLGRAVSAANFSALLADGSERHVERFVAA